MTENEMTLKNKQEASTEERTRPGRAYQPDVDIYETSDGLWLWADVPGVDEGAVTVNLADGVLAIEGPVAVEEYAELSPVYTEYRVGNWVRRFALSNDIDTSGIEARMVNGVLELKLPKSERARPRKIEVRGSAS